MIESGTIPFELQDRVDRELEPGERVVWMDRPVPRYFTGGSFVMFLFAIPWTAFALFWMYGAAGFKIPDFTRGPEAFFPLFGVPFVLIGLALLTTPYWTFLNALRTVYVITDRRAILFEGGWSTTIRSYLPDQIQEIYRKEHRNGSGDVILGRHVRTDADGDKHSTEVGFLNVREAKAVEGMLRGLAKSPPRGHHTG